MKLLHIDTSVLGENSVSRQLGAAAVDNLAAPDPRLEVRHRDLDRDPVPHLPSRTLSGEDASATALGDTVLQEFIDAHVVVIGVPFYNFGIPSTLKAWIDRIAVAGKTFRYTQDGPQGLAGGKRVILAIASGGPHAGTPRDFAEPCLRTVLGFLGIDDIQAVRAEGVAISPEHRTAALTEALASIPQPMPLAA